MFPKQHHLKLQQFARRTLIAVAEAQIVHTKHSAANSKMCVATGRVYICVFSCLCVDVCVLESRGGMGSTRGPSALFCSSALIWDYVNLGTCQDRLVKADDRVGLMLNRLARKQLLLLSDSVVKSLAQGGGWGAKSPVTVVFFYLCFAHNSRITVSLFRWQEKKNTKNITIFTLSQ